MIYDIITYIILAIALFFVVKSIAKRFAKKKLPHDSCNSGCGGCSTPCELKDAFEKSKS